MTNSPPTALPQALVGATHSESSPDPLAPHILAMKEMLQECAQPF